MSRVPVRLYHQRQTLSDGNKPIYIHGRLTYDFHLIVPFVNQVIYAFGKNVHAKAPDDRRVMKNFVYDVPSNKKLPTLRMQSAQRPRQRWRTRTRTTDMVIQRRWRYN